MEELQTATFAGGCFWCLEAVFKRVKGVKTIESGFSGGSDEDPGYNKKALEETGHAEAIQLTFDTNEISYEDLVEIFFKLHDPTTLNRQGNDIGTQYRSEVFYHNENQKQVAQNQIEKLAQKKYYHDPIVTKVTPYKNFFKAEAYHQDFYDSNPNYPYCQLIIDPKIKKLMTKFNDKVK